MAQAPAKSSAEWRSRLQRFQSDCQNSGPREQAKRIREANQIFHGVTKLFGGTTPLLLNDQQLEGMLSAEAYESAALALIDKDASFMLSRGSSGLYLATVVAPGGEEMTAEGSTLALAVLAAQSSVLLCTGEERPNNPVLGNLTNLFALTSCIAAMQAIERFQTLAV